MDKKTLTERMLEETLTDNSKIEYCKQCKDCIFKDKRGYEKAICMIYENPGYKPLHVINNKGICEYYNNED